MKIFRMYSNLQSWYEYLNSVAEKASVIMDTYSQPCGVLYQTVSGMSVDIGRRWVSRDAKEEYDRHVELMVQINERIDKIKKDEYKNKKSKR